MNIIEIYAYEGNVFRKHFRNMNHLLIRFGFLYIVLRLFALRIQSIKWLMNPIHVEKIYGFPVSSISDDLTVFRYAVKTIEFIVSQLLSILSYQQLFCKNFWNNVFVWPFFSGIICSHPQKICCRSCPLWKSTGGCSPQRG